jgi:hypothetical protein
MAENTVGDYLNSRKEGAMRDVGISPEDLKNSGSEPKKENVEFDDNTPIKLNDGSTMTLKELKEGSLRHSDYTKKTMSLAEEKKAFENRKQELEAFVSNMDKYYNENPEAYNEVIKHFKVNQEVEVPEGNKSKKSEEKKETVRNYEYDKTISSLKKELDAVKEQQSNDKAQLEVDKAIAHFTSTHSNLSRENVDEVLKVAQENIVPNKSMNEIIDNAYKIWEFENLSKSRQLSQEQQRLEKVSSQYFGGGDKGGLKQRSDGELLKEAIFKKQSDSIL